MTRVISVFLPNLSTDRVRRQAGRAAPPAETPLVLLAREAGRRVVRAVDAAARAAGLRIGMAATMAQTLVPDLVLQDADPAADRALLDRLALWMHRSFAPIVAADPPDGIVLESSGADHLHGGEAAMLATLCGKLAGAGFHAHAAIADHRGAAHALARFAAPAQRFSLPGRAAADIAALPLAALRLAPAVVEALHLLGFARIGDLSAEPRAPLALRFGPELGRRLDQAHGRIAEPIAAIRPPARIAARLAFAEPIAAAETIARCIGTLAARLCESLESKGLGARHLDLLCQRVDRRAQALRVGTALPLRDVRRMTRLLCDRIETIDPGFGIEAMTLTAIATERLAPSQVASCLIEEAVADVSDLIDLLANRVGAGNLYRLAPVPSDVAERAVRRIPPLAPPTGADWPLQWPRPARLLTPPEPIETVALLPDHPPVFFTWRGVRRRVHCADGPERIFGEWWKRDAEQAAVRDYFRIEADGGERYWVFRAGDGRDAQTGSQRWFLHGIFA